MAKTSREWDDERKRKRKKTVDNRINTNSMEIFWRVSISEMNGKTKFQIEKHAPYPSTTTNGITLVLLLRSLLWVSGCCVHYTIDVFCRLLIHFYCGPAAVFIDACNGMRSFVSGRSCTCDDEKWCLASDDKSGMNKWNGNTQNTNFSRTPQQYLFQMADPIDCVLWLLSQPLHFITIFLSLSVPSLCSQFKSRLHWTHIITLPRFSRCQMPFRCWIKY